jgi:hypothetical protein
MNPISHLISINFLSKRQKTYSLSPLMILSRLCTTLEAAKLPNREKAQCQSYLSKKIKAKNRGK